MTLYPALRLATVIAAMAFVVLFAGDLLISRSSGVGMPPAIPAVAPASVTMQAPEAARQDAPPHESPATETVNDAATAPARSAAPAAGAAAEMSAAKAVTESTALSLPTATLEATATADTALQAQMMLAATPEPTGPIPDQPAAPAAEQPAAANAAAAAPTIEPLRVIEVALLALAAVLGIATLVVRQKRA